MEMPTELISRLHRAGARMWVDQGRLRVRTTHQPLQPDDVLLIQQHKAELVRILLGDGADTVQVSTRSINTAPLTYRQESLWRLMRKDRTGASRLVSRALKLSGLIDIIALDKSFCAVADRHEALRTTIIVRRGQPHQNVTTRVASPLEVVRFPPVANDRERIHHITQRVLHELVSTAPDPFAGPLFRAKLLVWSPEECVLAVVVHHLITDAVSMALLWKELWQLYAAFIKEQSPTLPKVETQSGDYATWQRSDHFAWNLEFWQAKIEKTSRIQFPVDFAIKPSRTGPGAFYPLSLTPATSQALRDLASRERTMLGTVILALYATLTIYKCRQYEFALPFQVSGRLYPQHVNMMGYFAHPLLVCIRASETDRFPQLLQQVAREFTHAQRSSDCGKLLNQVPDLFGGGLFQWFSDLAHSETQSLAGTSDDGMPTSFSSEEYPIAIDTENAVELVDQDIMLCLYESTGGIEGYMIYRTDLFTRDTIERLAIDLESLCKFAASRNQDPISTFNPTTS